MGIRDVIHIRSKYFDQKFHLMFYMHPTDDVLPPAPTGRSASAGRAEARPLTASRHATFADDHATIPTVSSHPLPTPTPRRTTPSHAFVPSPPHSPHRGPVRAAAHPHPHPPKDSAWASQIASLRRQLDDKDESLATAMRRIKAFQSTAASRRPEDAATVQALKQQLAEYRGGLTSAQSRLRDLESELRGVREENAWLRRLEDELHQGNPDLARAVDSSLARERAQQEIRNARVLELMAEKDHALRAAEQQARTAEQDARRYEGLVGSLRLELDAAEARAGDALAAKADLQAQLDRLVAELTADNAKWRGEAAEWKGQADRMREQVRATVATEHAQQIKELQAALAATQADLEATKKGRAQAGSDPMVPRSTVAAYQNLAEGAARVATTAQAGYAHRVAHEALDLSALRARVAELEAALASRTGTETGGGDDGHAHARALESRVQALEEELRAVTTRRIDEGVKWDHTTGTTTVREAGLLEAMLRKNLEIATLRGELAYHVSYHGATTPTAPGRASTISTLPPATGTAVDRNRVLQARNAELEALSDVLRQQVADLEAWARHTVQQGTGTSGGSGGGAEAGWEVARVLNARLTEATTAGAGGGPLVGGETTSNVTTTTTTSTTTPPAEVVSELHARLLDALRAKRNAENTLLQERRAREDDREAADSHLRRAKLDNSVRLATLEEAVQKVTPPRSIQHLPPPPLLHLSHI